MFRTLALSPWTVILLQACPAEEPLAWWEDPCGRRDPVERACEGDVGTVEVGSEPTCADRGIAPGDPCDAGGATCVALRPLACADDPGTIVASDAVLTCGAAPPDDTCPISLRSAKRDVVYLDAAERRAIARSALDLRLARYAYRDPANGVGPQLGYLLDDAPDAVFSGEGRVNLYAYTSAVLAAVQEQQEELDRLRAEVAALRAGCPSDQPPCSARSASVCSSTSSGQTTSVSPQNPSVP